MEIISAGNFSALFSSQFVLRLICRFTELDTSIDEIIGVNQQIAGNALKGEETVVNHFEKELDYCINIQGIAYNVFDNFSMSCRLSLIALMEPPMFGIKEPLSGCDPASQTGWIIGLFAADFQVFFY